MDSEHRLCPALVAMAADLNRGMPIHPELLIKQISDGGEPQQPPTDAITLPVCLQRPGTGIWPPLDAGLNVDIVSRWKRNCAIAQCSHEQRVPSGDLMVLRNF